MRPSLYPAINLAAATAMFILTGANLATHDYLMAFIFGGIGILNVWASEWNRIP